MPEGPSIIILKELLAPYKGKKVLSIVSDKKIDIEQFHGKTITAFKTWGKHLLICFKNGTIRIHLMMFGTYLIDDRRKRKPRLGLEFTNGTVNFYACNVKIIEEPLQDVYDWSADIMSNKWNPRAARKKLKEHPDMLVCDALMSQDIFSGSGNIIKNETLFRVRIHPSTKVGALPSKKMGDLIRETSKYSFDFLKWKKEGTLGKHWLIYTKKECSNCGGPVKKQYLGKTKRRTFFCPVCQEKY